MLVVLVLLAAGGGRVSGCHSRSGEDAERVGVGGHVSPHVSHVSLVQVYSHQGTEPTFEKEEAAIKEILFDEYVRIINIFDYYSGRSSYPTISMNDFTSFANECNIRKQSPRYRHRTTFESGTALSHQHQS